MNPDKTGAQSPADFEPVTPPRQDRHEITIIAMAVFVLMSLGAIVFLYYQNQQLKNLLSSYQTPPPSSQPIPTQNPTEDWQTYTNTKLGVQFKYPATLKGMDTSIVESASNPNHISLSVPEADVMNFELYVIRNIGTINWYSKAYGEANQKTPTPPSLLTGPVINGYPSLTQTFNLDPFGPITHIFIEKGKDLYTATYPEGSTALPNQILSTFKFIGPTASPSAKPVACTLEAKLCPDGSSVGRTGPNCEFAPCPTP